MYTRSGYIKDMQINYEGFSSLNEYFKDYFIKSFLKAKDDYLFIRHKYSDDIHEL